MPSATSTDGTNKTNAVDQSKGGNFSNWIEEAKQKLTEDKRAQPWKQTFGDSVDRGLEGEDRITLRGPDDVAHNGGSVAGWSWIGGQ